MKEELHDDVRPSLEEPKPYGLVQGFRGLGWVVSAHCFFEQAADAGDAEAALREVAANVFCENPSAAVLQKLNLSRILGRLTE